MRSMFCRTSTLRQALLDLIPAHELCLLLGLHRASASLTNSPYSFLGSVASHSYQHASDYHAGPPEPCSAVSDHVLTDL